MTNKYYKEDGENYKLIKSSGLMYMVIALFVVMGALGVWVDISTGKMGGLGWSLACFAVIALIYYRQRYVSVVIRPQTKTIQVMHGKKVHREFPFDKFMNFQKTRVRNNGITTQWHVSMYVDDNGKNRNIMLGTVGRQKSADQIIAETEALLKSVK